jgi:FRG domain
MVDVVQVDSAERFFEAVEPHKTLLFRGQAKEYPGIIPSLFRTDPPLDLRPLVRPAKDLYFTAHKVNEEISRFHDEEFAHHYGPRSRSDDDPGEDTGWLDRLWLWVGKKLGINVSFSLAGDDDPDPDNPYSMGFPETVGSGFGTRDMYPDLCGEFVKMQFDYEYNDWLPMGLLQHYGVPTGTIDVTYDPAVALWFACFRYARPQGDVAAYYEANPEQSVVYVMDAPSGRLIDLRAGETVPIAGLRGRRQVGGLLLGATADQPDLSDVVVKKIQVAPGTFDSKHTSLEKLTQRYVFPPPQDDVFYRVLLEAKESTDPAVRNFARYIVKYS